MTWIAFAIVFAAVIIASAVNRIYKQREIDQLYENLSEEEKIKLEESTDQTIKRYEMEGFENDAKKIRELTTSGMNSKQIAEAIDMTEDYVVNLKRTNFYRKIKS